MVIVIRLRHGLLRPGAGVSSSMSSNEAEDADESGNNSNCSADGNTNNSPSRELITRSTVTTRYLS